MLTRIHCLLLFITACIITCLVATSALAQNSVSEFQSILREKSVFNEADFTALGQGQAVVRSLPVADKREVAVCGMVRLQVPAEQFLKSFRESLTRKVNPAILEIGRFSDTPTPADVQTLTIENRDLEDLKECVVGDCKLKLSAKMIERLQREVDWEAPDYRIQATQLLKEMLLDYVSDYLARGDAALIEYNDQVKAVDVGEEQTALKAGLTYGNNVLNEFRQVLNGVPKSGLTMVESAIVWSKIKFGLKPVIAINHIMIYTRDQESGPQVLVTSKQIYASHYFDSSLALTSFVSIPGTSHGSYLIYENRSRADALGGFFGKMKRGIVEQKAVDNLKNILESSKTNLDPVSVNQAEFASPADKERGWEGWKVRRVHVFFSLLLVTVLVTLFIGSYGWKSSLRGGTSYFFD